MQIRSNAESIAFYRSGDLEMKKTNSRLQVLNSQLIENYFIVDIWLPDIWISFNQSHSEWKPQKCKCQVQMAATPPW